MCGSGKKRDWKSMKRRSKVKEGSAGVGERLRLREGGLREQETKS